VRPVGIVGKNWAANPCPQGCYASCDQGAQFQIGADGLEPGLAALIAPVAFNPNMTWVGCYYVEAVENIKQTDGGCYYASLSVHTDEGPNTALLFHANRDSHGLTPGAALHYGNWMPELVDQDQPPCACDELEGVECCPGSDVVAKQFMLGDPVLPGGMAPIFINQSPFTFYAAQAQSGITCGIDPETSWALWPPV
jgi:hypothetical protein